MPRGYFSLRTADANRLHHLSVNAGGRATGNFWVAYTLHFGGRKRRIRRSLGTRCVEDAILRRDKLFASIERDGEEVPERRPKAPFTVEGASDMPLSTVMPYSPSV